MGWSGGTEIFDAVVEELKDLSWNWVREEYHEYFMEPLRGLLIELEKQDWDNHQESNYWDHPVVGKILGNELEEVDE